MAVISEAEEIPAASSPTVPPLSTESLPTETPQSPGLHSGPVPGSPPVETTRPAAIIPPGASSFPTPQMEPLPAVTANNPPKGVEDDMLDSGGLLSIRIIKGKRLCFPPPFSLISSAPSSPTTGQHFYTPNPQTIQASPTGGAPCRRLVVIAVLEYDKNEVTLAAQNDDYPNPLFKHRAHFDVAGVDAEIVLSVWIKSLDSGEQVFVGSNRSRPNLVEGKTFDDWMPLFNEQGDLIGELEIQTSFKKPEKKRLAIEDFELLKVIGKGSFGKVMQVRKKDTGRIYAMKIIRKQNIVARDEVEHTIAERRVLARLTHPFIVSLKFSFQTPDKLYLVLAFVNGGELFKHLQDEGSFDERRARFYTAELLMALEYLHGFDIVYRDLKPENILLDSNGHIALCDFGLCKVNMTSGKKTNTFCGTPEYLAPELLLGEGYTKVVDWWTLGILLYEMITGLPPFFADDIEEMYQKILNAPLVFPPEVSPKAQSLLRGLLDRSPSTRLGSGGAHEIRAHPFFADIRWDKLHARQVAPPFRPEVGGQTDTRNFDEEFTTMMPVDSVVESGDHLSSSVQAQFDGFTYVAESKMTYAATPHMSSFRPSSSHRGF
ncbi:AGC/AKT protein kinase [Fonticula alba]|uniref:non-specific serine/threonine protein kinase n=1 Tax=Fonticula alba TaxID=691883 RepID=A0A058Z607_FONAL|nr:AGC/AKT protein kinase [Fonticula alba]KCV69705.1 AGC/AKT protein kinase [Fonticula alba]|eukprot:XP_009496270.1 AGC/AKT protein kinase [Fonticula alba]